MRLFRICSLLFAAAVLVCFASAQSTPVSAPTQDAAGSSTFVRGPAMPIPPPLAQPNDQGASLLQQCLTAVGGQAPVSDVTLTGKITVFIPGGTTDTGTVTMVARGDSQAEITMAMATGTRTEVRSVSGDGTPAEMRTGPDGVVTHNPVHSLLSPHPAWFFPQFVLSAQSLLNLRGSFVGTETRNGIPVNRLAVWQLPPAGSPSSPLATQHDTQYDLYLDPGTSLPLAMVYYVQPDYRDRPPLVNRDTRAPVEMRFSDYQSVRGVPVALHIQTFIQSRQIYDIQLSSAEINTGVIIPSAN